MTATPLTLEQYNQKANVLLDSVVSDIQVKLPPPPPPPLDRLSLESRKDSTKRETLLLDNATMKHINQKNNRTSLK
jgi:hypothetical protein